MNFPVLAFFNPMIPTQEVVINTGKGRVIRIDFDNHDGHFRPVGTVFQPEYGLASLRLEEYIGKEACEVFDRVLGRLIESLDGRGDFISEINNPCNDEFVSIDHQCAVVSKLSTPFLVKLNGQTRYTPPTE